MLANPSVLGSTVHVAGRRVECAVRRPRVQSVLHDTLNNLGYFSDRGIPPRAPPGPGGCPLIPPVLAGAWPVSTQPQA